MQQHSTHRTILTNKGSGTHIVDKAEFAWPWVAVEPDPEKITEEHVRLTDYDEETVLEIAEAGYNFVRVSIDTRYFFSEDEYIALPYVGQDFYGNIDTANLNQYENLDRLIEWCIENNIHVCLDCHSTPGGLNYYNSWAKENNVRWMLQEYGCSTYIPQEQQIEYYKMITETCKSMDAPYCLWAFNNGDFGICIWAEGDRYVTPGATYDETCAGHRINTELVKITTE